MPVQKKSLETYWMHHVCVAARLFWEYIYIYIYIYRGLGIFVSKHKLNMCHVSSCVCVCVYILRVDTGWERQGVVNEYPRCI